jgi:hypothetical protein
MEIRAVLELTRAVDGPLVVVSDSTYVVNCWRDSWWRGWLAKGWKNSQRKPVANRDLWEPLVEVFRDRPDFSMEWVKGHGGDPMNDLVDRLAVAASYERSGSGDGPPPQELLDQSDRPGLAAAAASGPDPRVPDGWRLVVTGLRDPSLEADAHPIGEQLTRILDAQRQLHDDLVVLTGLRAGAEAVGAGAAQRAGVPYVAVLPYPDPVAGRPEADQARFQRLLDAAERVVVLERKRPTDGDGRRASLQRRDGWLRKVADSAVVVTDGEDTDAELALERYGDALGDELWEYRTFEL